MFTQPLPQPISGPQASTSPRQSRLRGFTYLRNYTHNHILSREAHHSTSSSSSSSSSNAATTTTTTATATATTTTSGSSSSSARLSSPQRSHAHGPSASAAVLGRSASYTVPITNPASSFTTSFAANALNRLTLVSTAPPDVVSIPPPSTVRAQSSRADTDPPRATTATIAEVPSSSTVAEPPSTSSTSSHSPSGSTSSSGNNNNNNNINANTNAMTRDRPEGALNGSTAALHGAHATTSSLPDNAPSIRFSAYFDPRSTRPSLSFPPISRTLPTGTEVIRVGRYSERDSSVMAHLSNSQPSAAPVGFKSKVVSRRHCEFWYENGKWFIKDVKSSSGTFLNHIRLSAPSQESKAFPVNDGDIVQLGIDFKGGEEMIFRCVKMRLELNRGWQNKPNTFNIAAHKRLRTIANPNNAETGSSSSSQDCSICLNSIAPCQSLFVAPCSHTWHFKCVRSLLTSPQYPIFICPNCRAGADLEADVEEPNEAWLQYQELEERELETAPNGQPAAPETAVPDHPLAEPEDDSMQVSDVMDLTVNITAVDGPLTPQRDASSHAMSEPVHIRNSGGRVGRGTPSPPSGAEGPITPRNDAGPWVFDGRGGRRPADAAGEMRSLDATADMASDDSSR